MALIDPAAEYIHCLRKIYITHASDNKLLTIDLRLILAPANPAFEHTHVRGAITILEIKCESALTV